MQFQRRNERVQARDCTRRFPTHPDLASIGDCQSGMDLANGPNPMKTSSPLLLLTPVFLLASCISTTYQDTLIRAELEGPLPRPPVHLPGKDSGFSIQGSLVLTGSPQSKHDVSLEEPDQTDGNGNWGHGRKVTWLQQPLMGSGEISLLYGGHLRGFLGLQGDLHAKAVWGGAGLVLGRKYPLEIAVSTGKTTLDRELEGVRQTTITETCDDDSWGCTPQTKVIEGQVETEWDRSEVAFNRLALTWSGKDGGPWGEFALTSYTNLARTIEGNWKYDGSSTMVGAGWTFATPYGRLVTGLRAETLGESLDPSALVQWTGDFSLD